MSHWLEFPLVTAPSSEDRSRLVSLQISRHFVTNNAHIHRRTPIFQLWGHVAGEVPPIPNSSVLSRPPLVFVPETVEKSVACFRGVNRPYDEEVNGDDVLVYVLNPSISLAYEPSLVCLAKPVSVPPTTCATVQVKSLREPLQIGDIEVRGTVTRIEFVRGDGGTPCLPVNHQHRYSQRLW